jgi:hypothetical protein
MSELRIELKGEDAYLGKVPASDVARLLMGVDRALARAATVVLGRPKTRSGRYKAVVEESSRLRLRAIEGGSVIPVLEVGEDGEHVGALDIDVASLGESAVDLLLDTADATRPDPHRDHVVAQALLDLGDSLHIGERYDALTFEYRHRTASQPRRVRLDASVRSRLREVVVDVPPSVRDDTVVGTLVEADFESWTARLRGPMQAAVTVNFDEELADAIQEALRQPAAFEGEVAYDADTFNARSVKLRRVTTGRQTSLLDFDPDEFWHERSLTELAAEQGTGRPLDPEQLFNTDASEEDREAFMSALAELP